MYNVIKGLVSLLAVQSTAGAGLRGSDISTSSSIACPDASNLTFRQFNPGIPHGVVEIFGYYNGTEFISNNEPVPGDPPHSADHPLTNATSGLVENATLIGPSDHSCLYEYPNFLNQIYHLIMSPAPAELETIDCPDAGALSFAQINPGIANSPVVISGVNADNTTYVSHNLDGGDSVLHPMADGTEGKVSGATSRGSAGAFCLYNYEGFTGVDVYLAMAPAK
jgi:hypothetical protein